MVAMDVVDLLACIYLGVAVACVSVTLTRSYLFENLRNWICRKNKFIGKLISCPYCAAHWIGFIFIVVYSPVPFTPALRSPTLSILFSVATGLFFTVAVSSIVVGRICTAIGGCSFFQDADREA